MKRKTILSLILIFTCAVSYFIYLQYRRVEDRVLKNIGFYDSPRCINELCRKHKIPIVLEGYDHGSEYGGAKTNVYSAEKITVRQLLDKIVPKDFTWTSNGKVIHIISKNLASRPDYQMNTIIERFSAKNVDRNTLIHMAVAQAGKGAASEPLVYGEFPFKRFNYKFDPPKISIDMKHATLREILDQISLKADFCYTVERAKNGDVLFTGVPVGSYALWIVISQDWTAPKIPLTKSANK